MVRLGFAMSGMRMTCDRVGGGGEAKLFQNSF